MKIKLKSKHNFLRHALAGAAGLAMLAGTATAATTSICDAAGGYVVAYYNDTLSLPDDADAQRAAMRIARHGRNTTGSVETLNSEPVRYETFYSLTPTQLQALASAYRSALDGALSAHWEYFWDFLGGDNSAWSTLAGQTGDSRFTALTSSFAAQVTSQKAASVSALTTVGNTQKARIQALYTERQKVTLASLGSQGTLFADQSFTAIGSPSNDSALRLSLTSRPGTSDATALAEKMAALVTPSGLHNNQGFFTATLSWSVPSTAFGADAEGKAKTNDFDLHVIEPTPPATASNYVQWVHFSKTDDPGKGGGGEVSKQGYAGYLDADSEGTSSLDTTEHYYATCDGNRLLEGTYWVSVTGLRAQIPALTSVTLQLATAQSGEVYTKTWSDLTVNPLPEFTERARLTFPVKIELKKNADGTWAKPVVTPYAPSASYASTGLPAYLP
ncbi:MAG: hypothetical protein L6Q74_17935 [Sphaerotilus natans subsp. sulfidivorans]|uniref:hypothetical protein n=1 Tax=Sphaerotilus sulfidivorans TaxID=639200 RepID=UPI002357F06B|nr:hypothetical protein [Sphaerotilus sulfidivorans]MCK6403759.1 hypothetical protein [Sphaerotilus sulfidivorans]